MYDVYMSECSCIIYAFSKNKLKQREKLIR